LKIRRLLIVPLIFAACIFAAGCFSIEQEIFLNADGSGEMVLHISLPDLPDNVKKTASPEKDPDEMLAGLKKDVTLGLPPTIKLKEIKEVRQNGAHGFYAVLQFTKLQDVQSILENFGKESLKDKQSPGPKDGQKPSAPVPAWNLQIQKTETRTLFAQSFFVDMSDATNSEKPVKAEAGAKTSEGAEASVKMEGLEDLTMMFLSTIKMRFVLHAPSPIIDTNADIVMNSRTAVWNGSFAAFYKDNKPIKKPIEMKASF
jgi:hypothetical protein